VTTYTSVDDCDRSTPPPDSDSDRSKGSDTDRTASCDSAHGDFQLPKDLQRAAKEQEEHISLLQAQCNQAVIGAQQQEQQYHELEEKYARQIAQRRSDKNKVDEAWEYCQEAKEQINDLKAQIETLENQRDIANAQHKAEMQTKNREMAQLRDNQSAQPVPLNTSTRRSWRLSRSRLNR
jgi:chromosome segregation ATPase